MTRSPPIPPYVNRRVGQKHTFRIMPAGVPRRAPFRVCLAVGSVLFASCAPSRPVREPARPVGGQRIRVGLAVNTPTVSVGGQGRVVATSRGRPAMTLRSGERVTIEVEGRGLRARGEKFETLTFVSLSQERFVTVNETPYRGTIEVFPAGDGVTAVNELDMEDYLPGVVGAELGRRSSGERAAVEAQAIASRTYAVKNLGRFSADGFDLRAGVSDQAYGGVVVETELIRGAVRSTAGLILTYRGEPIHAFFHSTCGYATAAPDESFRSVRSQPYLRSVPDAKPGGYYCDISPQFRWRVEWDERTLRDILRRTLPQVLGIESQAVDRIESVGVRRTGPSGRATEVRVRVGRGDVPVFGPDLRAVFATPEGRPLGSTAVQLSERREGGRLRGVVAAGAGWGHGVGMCQWGAIGRARAGQSTRTILTTYYSGATIERWY